MQQCNEYVRRGCFDLVCLQEAWLGPDVLLLSGGWPFRLRHQPPARRWGFSGLWPYSGLLTLAREEPNGTATLGYRETSWHKMDWLARKGAAFTDWGAFWVCTTHLDAGREPQDKQTRRSQVGELIAELSHRKPFVLTGDLNLKPREDKCDRAELERLTSETGAVVVAGEELDFVLASPELDAYRFDCPSVEKGLSDHLPLCVEIRGRATDRRRGRTSDGLEASTG
jgi:endonuclease/exonuclease/phosphatase family metal-dependent hydrolase